MNYAQHDFWPTSFFAFGWPEHHSLGPTLLKYLYEERDRQQRRIASGVAPGAKSAYGLYESDFDLLNRQHPAVQSLRTFIVSCIQLVVGKVNEEADEPSGINVEIPDSWFHITNGGGFHDAHVHNGCSWCGICYLQIGDSGPSQDGGAPNGGSRFYSPLWRGGTHSDYGNQYLGKAYIDPPIQDGMVLIFPSYLLHSGLPYRGEKDRVLIAFNTVSNR